MKNIYLILIACIVLLVSCKKDIDIIQTPITPINCSLTSLISKNSDDTYYISYEYDSKGRRSKRSLNSLTTSYVDEYVFESSKITQSRKFKNGTDYMWVYSLNSDGRVASSTRNANGKIDIEQFKYNGDGYLLESISSSGINIKYEYLDGNLAAQIVKYNDGSTQNTTYQYYLDKLDPHKDYFISYGIFGKGNTNLVKSSTLTRSGNVLMVDESYMFDDKGNISQIMHDSKDIIAKGIDKFAYECK